LRFTTSCQCRMAALVRHFGDEEDASLACGVCDVCDPAGAVLRLFRRATTVERHMAQSIVDALRPVGYIATGTLQRSLDPASRITRDDFDGLLDAMVRTGLIAIEEACFEKDGQVRRYRKVRATEKGLQLRSSSQVDLLIPDGMVEAFRGRDSNAPQKKQAKGSPKAASGTSPGFESMELSGNAEALATRFKQWRAAEAKRLGVPAYVVMHDRTLRAVAQTRPRNRKELLEIDGMGPLKVEKFGEAILALCGGT
jgi:superfamily II DNA helicase RecQ